MPCPDGGDPSTVPPEGLPGGGEGARRGRPPTRRVCDMPILNNGDPVAPKRPRGGVPTQSTLSPPPIFQKIILVLGLCHPPPSGMMTTRPGSFPSFLPGDLSTPKSCQSVLKTLSSENLRHDFNVHFFLNYLLGSCQESKSDRNCRKGKFAA